MLSSCRHSRLLIVEGRDASDQDGRKERIKRSKCRKREQEAEELRRVTTQPQKGVQAWVGLLGNLDY